MAVRQLFLAALVAGCTVPPATSPVSSGETSYPISVDEPFHRATTKKAKPVVAHEIGHPLNCGTPEEFRICPLPVRMPIATEAIPDLTPYDDMATIIVRARDIAAP